MNEENRDENQEAIANQYDQFLYVKALSEPLRSMRMAALAARLEAIQRNGYCFGVVLQNKNGSLDVLPVTPGGYIPTNDPALREVYDLSRDLASQLHEIRAMHLENANA